MDNKTRGKCKSATMIQYARMAVDCDWLRDTVFPFYK